MSETHWLKRYYGKDFELLHPEVFQEGKRFAIVKLTRLGANDGFSGVGFVLIKKTGNHAASPYLSLHEGMPTAENIAEMKRALEKAD